MAAPVQRLNAVGVETESNHIEATIRHELHNTGTLRRRNENDSSGNGKISGHMPTKVGQVRVQEETLTLSEPNT